MISGRTSFLHIMSEEDYEEKKERIDEIKNLKLEKARMNDIELSIDMSEFSDNSHVTNEIKFNDEKVS